MDTLTVLYDQDCLLCQECRIWLLRQRAFIKLRFIPLQSPQICEWFQRLEGCSSINPRERLVVISDEGGVYHGQNAWIMCLYALRDYREWAQRLAHPALLPFARRVCELVSRNRRLLSRFLKEPTEELKNKLAAFPPALCEARGNCH